MPIIEVRNAVKTFGPITAVAGLDLDVFEGECFGLLGPNGAGKTTLVRMIIAACPLSGGDIRVFYKDIGKQPRQIKTDLGVVPQEVNLDPDLNVLENLMTYARYFDIRKAEARKRAVTDLRFFELYERRKAKVDELSSGMKRRLLIARGMINRPKLLILDEPTVGLDPQTKHLVWQKLRSLRDQGMTMLLTTQNMDEAWRLCDRLAIMNDGKVVTLGSPQELLDRYGGSQVLEARPPQERRDTVLSKLKEYGVQWEEIEDTLYIFQGDGQMLDDELKHDLAIINQHLPSLEDVFLRVTGRSIRE